MKIVCPLFLRKIFPDSIKIWWKSLTEKFMNHMFRTCWKLKLAISSVAKFHLIGNAVSVLIGFFISFRIGFPRCMCPSYHEGQTIPFEAGLRLMPRRPLSTPSSHLGEEKKDTSSGHVILLHLNCPTHLRLIQKNKFLNNFPLHRV